MKKQDLKDIIDVCLFEINWLRNKNKKLNIENKELKEQLNLCGVVTSVLCVNVPKTWDITNGKKYRVIKEEENHFTIINDYGKEDSYHKDWLKKV